MLTSIFESTTLTVWEVLFCSLTSIGLGFIVAFVYYFKSQSTKNLFLTLVLLPVIVQAVIMMVNGNLGAGIAVMGAFSLVRFRSVPGNSKEICAVFFSMAIGLATGMGQLIFAAIFTIIVCFVFLIITSTSLGEKDVNQRHLKITIAENIDYTDVFNDIFEKYVTKLSLEKVKTTNLGSMYELSYVIVLNDPKKEKEMIDCIRCRNGNLPIVCGRYQGSRDEL